MMKSKFRKNTKYKLTRKQNNIGILNKYLTCPKF